MNATKNDAKKIFWQKGTCSQTFFFLLNREFGHLNENHERASDPCAGGLMQTGHQCGMLWGASLAVGAESHRRHNDKGKAIALAINTTQYLMKSFEKRTKTHNCREITACNLTTGWGMSKLIIKSICCGFIHSHCFNLAKKWAPEAIQSAKEGLASEQFDYTQQPLSCASEVVKKMGGSDEEIIMVAGFAGGLGLSGNACGALSATVWMKMLKYYKDNPGKSPMYFKNPVLKKIMQDFDEISGSEILCQKITGRNFQTIDEHTGFIKCGGCSKLLEDLAHI